MSREHVPYQFQWRIQKIVLREGRRGSGNMPPAEVQGWSPRNWSISAFCSVDTSPDLREGVKMSSKPSKWLFDIKIGRHERNCREFSVAGSTFTFVQKYFLAFLRGGGDRPHRPLWSRHCPVLTNLDRAVPVPKAWIKRHTNLPLLCLKLRSVKRRPLFAIHYIYVESKHFDSRKCPRVVHHCSWCSGCSADERTCRSTGIGAAHTTNDQ